MRKISLEDLVQESARVRRGGIIVPGGGVKRNWPLCLTCGRDVEAAEIKNANSKGCEIWARCHGKEDFVHVTWNVPVRDATADVLEDKNVGWAIRRAMSDFSPFPPAHQFDFSSKRS